MKRVLCLVLVCLLLAACTGSPEGEESAAESTASAMESSEEEPMESMRLLIGNQSIQVDAYNPQKDVAGVCVFDKNSGLTVSGTGKGYADVLVFDSVVADIVYETGTVMPFPNGYLVRMPKEYAQTISRGDSVGVFGMEINTTPKDYVLVKDRIIIPIFYQNESRTAAARAVLYDGDYIHDSTDTNIWGIELAVGPDGIVTEAVPTNIEGKSGNTQIPKGGFVLSSGNTNYINSLRRVKAGDSAKHITEFGLYDFYTIEELKKTYEDGEYLTKVDSGVTLYKEGAFEVLVDANGVVQSFHEGGGIKVPEGGCILYATGYKRTELKRFVQLGDTVFVGAGKLCIYRNEALTCSRMGDALDRIASGIASAKEHLYTIDYAKAEQELENARKLLADGAYEQIPALISELEQIITPYFAVQERGAWLTDYDSDLADVKRTVAYAKSLGLNTLFVAPFRDTHPLFDLKYEHLDRHPDVTDDLLQGYVEEAHKVGIQVIFTISTFTTQKPSMAHSNDHYVNYFGDKLLLSKTGRDVAYFYSEPSYTLDPYDPEVRAWYIGLIKAVCDKYDVDGVQLDYIRFPLPSFFGEERYEDFGYNEDIMQAFMKQEHTNEKPNTYSITDKRWDRWCKFRCNIITTFIHELKQAIGEMPLTCTCFADANDRAKYVFQDVASWVKDVEAIYPMIYSPDLEGQVKYGDELYGILGETTRIVLGIGTYDGETDASVTDQYLYSMGFADGNAIFALTYTQTFGFDKTYQRLFAKEAVRTDAEGKTVQAYLNWMAETCELVYAYLYDADVTAVAQALRTEAERFGASEATGSAFVKEANDAIRSLQGLANQLPEDVRADFAQKLTRLKQLCNR